MRWITQMKLRWRSLAQRRAIEAELDEELQFHLEKQAAEYEKAGMSPKTARAAAQRDFGGVTQFEEACRDERGWAPLENIARDLRWAARNLRRSPGLVAVAWISLGLGIGMSSAVLSIMDAVLLRPLPLTEPDRLVVIKEQKRGRDTGSNPPRASDWAAQVSAFSAVTGSYAERLTTLGPEGPERLLSLRICGDYLGVIGLQPIAGRGLTAAEAKDEGQPVALISEALWRKQGGDAAVLGRALPLGGTSYTIVGVLPAAASFPEDVQVWVPIPRDIQRVSRAAGFLDVTARLRQGVPLAQAQAQLAVAASRLAGRYPDTDAGLAARAVPLQEDLVQRGRPLLFVLLATFLAVLLLACVNLSGLLLARAIGRQREAAIRVALGAGRLRLMRLFLLEGVLLALGGALVGLFLAHAGLDVLKLLLPGGLPQLASAHLDTRAILTALLLALLSGSCASLLPAWQTVREASLSGAMREGAAATSGARRQGPQRFLVVAQTMLSLMLLVGAALLTRTFIELASQPLGFRPEQTWAVQINLPWDTPKSRMDAVSHRVLEKLAALPGVESVGLADRLPLQGASQGAPILVRHQQAPRDGAFEHVSFRAASPGYFSTLRIPLRAGRVLSPRLRPDATRETVVNEVLAKRLFPAGDAIGRYVTFNPPKSGSQEPPVWYEVVGVVGGIKTDVAQENRPEAYVLPEDTYWPLLNFVVRVQGDQQQFAAAMRTALREAAPEQTVDAILPLDIVVREAVAKPRLHMRLMLGLALTALLLTAIGIYGMLAQDVARRRPEFAVRLALGAAPGQLVREAVRRGLVLASTGVLLGTAGALTVSRSLQTLLYGITPVDPVSYLAAATALVLVAALASYLPARQAATTDPLAVLRRE